MILVNKIKINLSKNPIPLSDENNINQLKDLTET